MAPNPKTASNCRNVGFGCAKELRGPGDEKGAVRLGKATTHWLRHTHACHAITDGMPIKITQPSLGHASLTTTTVYVKTEEKRRMRAVKEFWQDRGASEGQRTAPVE